MKIKLSELRRIIKEETDTLRDSRPSRDGITIKFHEHSQRLLEGIRGVLSSVDCELLTISLSELAADIKRVDQHLNLTEGHDPKADIYHSVMNLKRALSLGVEYNSVRSIIGVVYRMLKDHMSHEPWAAPALKQLGNLYREIEEFAKNTMPDLVSRIDATCGDAARERHNKNQEIRTQKLQRMASKEDFGHVPQKAKPESHSEEELPTGKASPQARKNT